jgi:hypothetical protein
MAKLSAHGHEVARLTYGGPRPDSDALVSHETFTLSFRSDGHILRKQQVTFRSRMEALQALQRPQDHAAAHPRSR